MICSMQLNYFDKCLKLVDRGYGEGNHKKLALWLINEQRKLSELVQLQNDHKNEVLFKIS